MVITTSPSRTAASIASGIAAISSTRLFTNHAHIPAVLYGPGDVTLAHAANESIAVDEVLQAVHVLALFVADWCGATRA